MISNRKNISKIKVFIKNFKSKTIGLRVDKNLASSRVYMPMPAPWISVGDLAMNKHDWKTAIEAYENVLLAEPERNATWIQLGHALKESGLLDRAIYAYRRALELIPHDPETLLHLAHLYLRNSDRDQAIATFDCISRQAVESEWGKEATDILSILRKEDEAMVSLATGGAAMLERRWKDAVIAYAQFLRNNPLEVPIWIQYGHALKEQGFVVEAETAYREAYRLEPTNEDASFQLREHQIRRHYGTSSNT